EPYYASTCVRVSQPEIFADSAAPMRLYRPVDHLTCHRRRHHFDHCDFSARGLITDDIHHMRRLEREQPRLVYHDARLGDALQGHCLLRDWLAESDAFRGTLAHFFQSPLRHAYHTHAMVNAAGSQAALSNFEAAAFAQQYIVDRY